MECPTPHNCWVNAFFLDEIQRYFESTLLKSSGFEPVTSFSSDSSNAKQIAMCKRADISLCVFDGDAMFGYYETGKINRRTCAAFKAAGREFEKRWKDYRLAA